MHCAVACKRLDICVRHDTGCDQARQDFVPFLERRFDQPRWRRDAVAGWLRLQLVDWSVAGIAFEQLQNRWLFWWATFSHG